MAITYNWNFSPLEIVYNEDVMVDVIDIVHWQYSATDDDTGTSVQSIGSRGRTINADQSCKSNRHNFTPNERNSKSSMGYPNTTNSYRIIL
jgi:hypothetical protein